MSASDLQLEPLPGEGLGGLSSALRGEQLPHADLLGAEKRFFCASVQGAIVGYVGLERHGQDAILRSAVIFPHARRGGYGRAMVERLLRIAAEDAIERVWLLTTSAPRFFASVGFADVDRAAVPSAIAASAEFASLCPDTAVCMVYRLAAAASPLPGIERPA
jgi:N-acetylglutamate synthase-like GNAT family acetyltransferase